MYYFKDNAIIPLFFITNLRIISRTDFMDYNSERSKC